MKQIKITLPTPIANGDNPIIELTVRQPIASELFGLKLSEIIQMDVEAFATLIPRICQIMNKALFMGLESDNLVAIQSDVIQMFVGDAEFNVVDVSSGVKEITLPQPIENGEEQIVKLIVSKPDVGKLRQLKVSELLNMDIRAFATLMPRICPELTEPLFNKLKPQNLSAILMTTVGFFVPANDLSMT